MDREAIEQDALVDSKMKDYEITLTSTIVVCVEATSYREAVELAKIEACSPGTMGSEDWEVDG